MCPLVSDVEDTHEEQHAIKDEVEEEDQENVHQQDGERSLTMSLHDVQQQEYVQDQHSNPLLDEISSPVNAQIFDFCDPDMFSDTLQNSETTSSPNCYCYEDQNSSYTKTISYPSNFVNNDNNNNLTNNEFSIESLVLNNFHLEQNANTSTNTITTTPNSNNHPNHHHIGGLSIIFDSPDEIDNDNDNNNNDISASIDFSTPFPPPYNTQQDQYQLPLTDEVGIANTSLLHQYTTTQVDPTSFPFIGGPPSSLGTGFEDDCLSTIPPFLRINPSSTISNSSCCSFINPSMSSFLHGNVNPSLGSDRTNGVFSSSLLMTSSLQAKDLDFQGDNSAIFCTDQLPQVYNSGDIQAFSGENSQMVSGTSNCATLATEISSLEDSTFKVGKLSAEQRKEKIHRYLRKRNERNFSKKIKYACRKTLADSRPRVRGRFAKNDDFGEMNHRHINEHHEDEDYDEVAVKDEDDLIDSSDIFSHISGVNSFKCNYQIQSWI